MVMRNSSEAHLLSVVQNRQSQLHQPLRPKSWDGALVLMLDSQAAFDSEEEAEQCQLKQMNRCSSDLVQGGVVSPPGSAALSLQLKNKQQTLLIALMPKTAGKAAWH